MTSLQDRNSKLMESLEKERLRSRELEEDLHQMKTQSDEMEAAHERIKKDHLHLVAEVC